MNSDGKVTVAPHSKCKVIVNGVPVTNRTKLQHLVGSWSGHSSASVIPQDGGGGGGQWLSCEMAPVTVRGDGPGPELPTSARLQGLG